MSKQQLSLHGRKPKKTRIDTDSIARLAEGKETLRTALALDDAQLEALRGQSQALFQAGKWERCIDVILARAALDDLDPWDPLILARCFDALGDRATAAACLELGEELMVELDFHVRAGRTGKETVS